MEKSITEKQKIQFNKMLIVLRKIHSGYHTLEGIKKNSYFLGLDYKEALEMSYEDIQTDAGIITKGVKKIC